MILYVIRHGEPNYSTDSLTPKGKMQAEALAKRLGIYGIDVIYSSPLGRAKQTAEASADLLGLDINIEPWTSETKAWEHFAGILPNGDTGWVFNQQTTVLKNDQTVNLGELWYEAEGLQMIDGKGGYDELISSSDKFLFKLGYERQGSIYKIRRANNDKVALFCHFGFGLSWMSHLLQIPPHLFWTSFEISHASFSVFEFKNNEDGFTTPKCLCLSDSSHIYKEGLPLKYNNYIEF